jgi:cytochrome c oxidase assembly protein subunit 15
LLGLLLLQGLTGLSNVVLGWPLLAAVLHTAGAAALVVVLTRVLTLARPDGVVSILLLPVALRDVRMSTASSVSRPPCCASSTR